MCVCVHVWAQQKPLVSDPSSSLFCRLVEEGGSRHKNSLTIGGGQWCPGMVVGLGPSAPHDTELSILGVYSSKQGDFRLAGEPSSHLEGL